MNRPALSGREYIRQKMRLGLPLIIGQLVTIGIWTSGTITMGWIDSSSRAASALSSRFYQPFFFLALSKASLILTMRMMGAMRRIRDGKRILLA